MLRRKEGQVRRSRLGQAMVEYAIMIGAVSLVCLVAATILGHKGGVLMGYVAALLPGDDADDQGTVFVGKLTTTTGSNGIIVSKNQPGSAQAVNLGLPNGGIGGLISDSTDGS